MRRWRAYAVGVVVGFGLGWAILASVGAGLVPVAELAAQAPATYTDRWRLSMDPAWVGRVQVAALVGAITVIGEDPETADHARRLALASVTLREPDVIGRRLSVVLAAAVPLEVTDPDGDGPAAAVPVVTLTDAQLQTLIMARWSAFARALVPAAELAAAREAAR